MAKRITQKQILFCEFYISCGNATEAARKAGYKVPRQQGAENLSKPVIQERLIELQKELKSKRIATAEERQEFWTNVMRGDETTTAIDKDGIVLELMPEMKDRIKASELLGKSGADFIEKVDHTSSDGSMTPSTPNIDWLSDVISAANANK